MARGACGRRIDKIPGELGSGIVVMEEIGMLRHHVIYTSKIVINL